MHWLDWVKDEGGQAMVEMALVISLVCLMLILPLVDFGRVYTAQLTLNHATRTGARLGAVVGIDADYEANIETAVQGDDLNLNVAAGNIAVAFEDSSGNVPATPEVGDYVVVSTSHEVRLIAPVINRIFDDNRDGIDTADDHDGNFTIASEVKMRLERGVID